MLVDIDFKYNSDLDIELDINVSLLSDHNSIFEMKMNDHNHFLVAWLEYCMFYVFVKNIDLVSSLRRVSESVRVSFQKS